MKNCEYYQTLMSRLLDDDLTADARDELRSHIQTCPSCRSLFATFSQMTAALREGELEEPPAQLSQTVMERIAQAGRPRRGRRRPIRPWVRLGAAACLVLIVAGTAVVATRGSRLSSGAADVAQAPMVRTVAQQAPVSGDTGAYEIAEDAEMETAEAAPEDSVAGQGRAYGQDDLAAEAAPVAEQAAPAAELPVYDVAGNRLGVIEAENVDAFAALLTGQPVGTGGWDFLFTVAYQGVDYTFGTDSGGSTLVWWDAAGTSATRCSGTLADLRALIVTDPPALPE